MEILLLVLIAILLFGGKAVKNFAFKSILVVLGLMLIPVVVMVLQNPNWYIVVPSISIILLFFILIKGNSFDKTPAKPNANFKIVKDGRISYISIYQENKFVVLSPIEIRNLLYNWDSKNAANGKPFLTMFGTTFKLLSISKVVNNDPHLTKSLKMKGVNFYIEISQYSQHSHQTSHTVMLNPQTIVSLNVWMNEITKKDSFVRELYTMNNHLSG